MDSLVQTALEARNHAVCEYSHFAVGAALECADGTVIRGCNIENATFGLTICAERVAIFKALSEGIREFRRIIVATDAATLTPPCGACRQIIWEFCGDIPVMAVNPRGDVVEWTMSQLLPHAFDKRSLK